MAMIDRTMKYFTPTDNRYVSFYTPPIPSKVKNIRSIPSHPDTNTRHRILGRKTTSCMVW